MNLLLQLCVIWLVLRLETFLTTPAETPNILVVSSNYQSSLHKFLHILSSSIRLSFCVVMSICAVLWIAVKYERR